MFRQCVLVLMCGILGGVGTTWAEEAPAKDPLTDGLIFYAPLDGTLDATVAAGAKKPTKDKEVKLVDGKFGQGAQIKGAAQLYYSGLKNFNLKKGTVAMWVKRDQPWAANLFVFFKGVAGAAWNQNALYLIATDHAQLRAWVWDNDKKQQLIMSPNGISYEADHWYHLAATFTDGAVKIYVDGKEISYGTKADPMLEMPTGQVKYMQFGSDYTPDSVLDGVLDELRIYDRVLSPEEVAKLAAFEPKPSPAAEKK